MKKFYLAGPDVFRKDATQYGFDLKRTCDAVGVEGFWPFDNEISGENPAFKIRRANETMIVLCDGVLANISPFRGPNMDPGTAYEIGFARAIGRPVFLYSTVRQSLELRTRAANVAFGEFVGIEEFNLLENLMIAANEAVYSTFVEALYAAAKAVK